MRDSVELVKDVSVTWALLEPVVGLSRASRSVGVAGNVVGTSAEEADTPSDAREADDVVPKATPEPAGKI